MNDFRLADERYAEITVRQMLNHSSECPMKRTTSILLPSVLEDLMDAAVVVSGLRSIVGARSTLALVLTISIAAPATAQSAEDREAIIQTSLDYGEGWYEGNAERMDRALHPELAKRMVYTDRRTGRSRLNQQSAMTLVRSTRAGGGKNAQVADRSSTVTILDVFENAAVVKVDGPEWVDYLHLAKWNGRWVIVNVVWELKPESRGQE